MIAVIHLDSRAAHMRSTHAPTGWRIIPILDHFRRPLFRTIRMWLLQLLISHLLYSWSSCIIVLNAIFVLKSWTGKVFGWFYCTETGLGTFEALSGQPRQWKQQIYFSNSIWANNNLCVPFFSLPNYVNRLAII